MHAVILAGGLGTRLRSVVQDVPKPLAPISGKPFLGYLLDYLGSQGFSSATISAGYRGEMIQAALGETWGNLAIDYVVETKALGTGGALRQAFGSKFPAFAVNGDTYLELDYAAMLRHHDSVGAPLTIAVRSIEDTSRYGRMEVHDGRIRNYLTNVPGPGLISCGVYVFARNLLEGWPETFSFENDYLSKQIADIQPAAFRADGYFIDIGVPDDYARAQTELPARARRS